VTFTVGSISGRAFSGQVVQVRKAPLVLQNVVTYDVVVSAPNPELKLLPGMTANVQIITDQKDNALKVPNAALRFRPPGAEAGQVQNRAAGPAAAQSSGPRSGSGAQPGSAGQVWAVDPGGKLRAIPLRLGITVRVRGSALCAGRLGGRGRRAESGIVGATAKARAGAEAEVLGAVPECSAAHSP